MKYCLSESKTWCGTTLHRIKALKDIPFTHVKAGQTGGWVETEENLSQIGSCWLYNNAIACQQSRIYGDVAVHDWVIVEGHARLSGQGDIRGDLVISSTEEKSNA